MLAHWSLAAIHLLTRGTALRRLAGGVDANACFVIIKTKCLTALPSAMPLVSIHGRGERRRGGGGAVGQNL